MRFSSRVVTALILSFSLLAGLGGGVPGARGATSAFTYNNLQQNDPSLITELQAYDPNAPQDIQTFMNDLSTDLATVSGLTQANFDTNLAIQAAALYLTDPTGYGQLPHAFHAAFGFDLSSFGEGNIPTAFKPIADAVEAAVLGSGSSGSGGGGPPPAVQTPPAPLAGSISLDSQNIGKYESGEIATITYPSQATGPYSLTLAGGLMAMEGLTRLDVAFGPLTLQFPSDPAGTENAVVQLNQVGAADASLTAATTVLRGLNPLGQGWTISFDTGTGGQALTPDKPVTVSWPLPAGQNAAQGSVALYVYDAGKWSYLGGQVAGGSLQAAVQGGGEYALMSYNQSFTDVPASFWAAQDIAAMVTRNVVTGEWNGTFAPGQPVTRAEFAALLQRALGLSPVSGPSPFGDVSGQWFAGPVDALAKDGIVAGDGGNFHPESYISREEMAAMLVRALPKAGNGSPALQFKDDSVISSWAKEEVARAVQMGLVQGEPGGVFAPTADATRAQAVTMVERLLMANGEL